MSNPFSAEFDEQTNALLSNILSSVLRQTEAKFAGKTEAVSEGVANALASLARTGQRDRDILEQYALCYAAVLSTMVRPSQSLEAGDG
jgi:hypothetical protein